MTRSAGVWLLLTSLVAPVDAAVAGQSTDAASQHFVIIVHPSNSTSEMTRDQLSEIFRKITTQWPEGVPAHPVDQYETSATRMAFSRAVFGKDVTAIMSYWYQQVYSGRGVPPLQVKDDAAVVAIVRDDPGAIGYIARGSVPEGVRVVRLAP